MIWRLQTQALRRVFKKRLRDGKADFICLSFGKRRRGKGEVVTRTGYAFVDDGEDVRRAEVGRNIIGARHCIKERKIRHNK